MTPISASIAKCRELFPGIPDGSITVDAVLAIGPGNSTKPIGKYITTPFVFLRSMDDVVRNIFVADYNNAKVDFPFVNINLIQPSVPLPGDFLGFQYSKEMIDIGFGDAQNSTRCTQSRN